MAWQVVLLCEVHAQFTLARLQAEYTETPLGIDVAQPRFSWQMQAPDGVRGVAQQAYRIVVRDAEEDVVWDQDGQSASASEGVRFVGVRNGRVVYELASGAYEFTAPWSGVY